MTAPDARIKIIAENLTRLALQEAQRDVRAFGQAAAGAGRESDALSQGFGRLVVSKGNIIAASHSARRGFTLLENGMRALAFQAAGLSGGVGTASRGLLALGIPGGPLLVITAALGLAAIAWKRFADAGEEAEKRVTESSQRIRDRIAGIGEVDVSGPGGGRQGLDLAALGVRNQRQVLEDIETRVAARRTATAARLNVLPSFAPETAAETLELTTARDYLKKLEARVADLERQTLGKRLEADARRLGVSVEDLARARAMPPIVLQSGIVDNLRDMRRPSIRQPDFIAENTPERMLAAREEMREAERRRVLASLNVSTSDPGFLAAQQAARFNRITAGVNAATAAAGGNVEGVVAAGGQFLSTLPGGQVPALAASLLGPVISLFTAGAERRHREREAAAQRRHEELVGVLHEGPARINATFQLSSGELVESAVWTVGRQQRLGRESRLPG